MMNKKLINLAVAAAIAAPAAVMADATIYGVLHQSIDYIDQNDWVTLELENDWQNPNAYDGPITSQWGNYVVAKQNEGFSGWSINRGDGGILDSFSALGLVGGRNVVEFGTAVTVESYLPEDFFDEDAAAKLADVNALVSSTSSAVSTYLGSIGLSNRPVGPSNRIGVKGSEDLGSGLKAIYQVEFGIPLSDGNGRAADGDALNSVVMRNSFVGLAGGFGTFLVGRHDTPLKISTGKLDMFADTMADYNGALGFDDKRTDNTVAYISPSWSGFQFAGAVHAGGRATVEGVRNDASDSLAEAWSVAAIYSNGPWYASAAYESLNADLSNNADDFNDQIADADAAILEFNSDYGTAIPLLGISDYDDYTKWRVGLGILDWNGFSLTGIYEDRSDTNFVGGYDTKSWQVQAGYAFGNNMVKAAYGAQDRDLDRVLGGVDTNNDGTLDDLGLGGGDLSQWTIAFDHNFSKRTKVYALYNNVDDDFLPDWDGFSLGLVHKF